jgi:pyruvate/2-oxoglutarate dehydrogenase complex dihydrolipoamide acyltransferase (E2) component
MDAMPIRAKDAVTMGSQAAPNSEADASKPARSATRFEALESPSSFRKMAAAMWSAPNDPSILGAMDIDATRALAYLDEAKRRYGVRLTVTHLVARATALAIARHPEINVKVRFGGRLERRLGVDVFLSIATEGGRDLSGTKIQNADKKSLPAIAAELTAGAKSIRANADPSYKKSRDTFKRMPWWMVKPALRISDALANELHLDLPQLGLPRDPFGSAVVTSVGMFGIDTAFAPFVPLARCPMLLLVPEIRERPWVEAGQVVARPILRLCATFDHRVIDGFAAGALARTLRELLEHPERTEPEN